MSLTPPMSTPDTYPVPAAAFPAAAVPQLPQFLPLPLLHFPLLTLLPQRLWQLPTCNVVTYTQKRTYGSSQSCSLGLWKTSWPRPPLLTSSQPAPTTRKNLVKKLRRSSRQTSQQLQYEPEDAADTTTSPIQAHYSTNESHDQAGTKIRKGVSVRKQTIKLRSKIERRVLLFSRSASELSTYPSKGDEGGRRRGPARRGRG